MNNKNKIKEYNKKYYQKHKEILREQGREYYHKHKIERNRYAKVYRESNPIKYWCLKTISTHKGKGLKILFTYKELLPLAQQTKYCFLCKEKLIWGKNNKIQDNSPTLDRINNEKTLTLNDVQIICHKCNATKRNRTMKEFVNYCKKISNKFVDYLRRINEKNTHRFI